MGVVEFEGFLNRDYVGKKLINIYDHILRKYMLFTIP